MDWLSKGCAWDRRLVRKIAGLLEIPVDALEADVEVDAKEMLADSRFDAPSVVPRAARHLPHEDARRPCPRHHGGRHRRRVELVS